MKESKLQNSLVVALLALVCCFLWGSAFPCVKLGYQLFSIAPDDTASQILFAGTRFTLAGILAIGIGSLLSRKLLFPAPSSWGMVVKLSLAQTVIQYLFFYIGLANTSGVKGSIIEASNVFFAILMSSLIFHYEKLGRSKLLGCVLGFAGVVLINLNGTGLDRSMSLQGEGFILLSTLSYALSSVLIKKYGQKENPVALSGYQFVLGGLIMVSIGLAMGGRLQGFTLPAHPPAALYGPHLCCGLLSLGDPAQAQSCGTGGSVRLYESGVWRHPQRNSASGAKPGLHSSGSALSGSGLHRDLSGQPGLLLSPGKDDRYRYS